MLLLDNGKKRCHLRRDSWRVTDAGNGNALQALMGVLSVQCAKPVFQTGPGDFWNQTRV